MKSIRYTMFLLLAVAMVFSTAMADGTVVNPEYKYAPTEGYEGPTGSAPASGLPPVGARSVGSQVIISEDFESYAEGELPPGWFQMDWDGGYCTQFTRLSTWQVFDYGDEAHSGTNVAMCHYNNNVLPNLDWLVIPVQALTGSITFSYWRSSQDPSWVDSYELRVSTTGTDTADFMDLLIDEDDIPVAWEQKTFDLSAYAGAPFYIAFFYNSIDKFVLKLDDVLLEADGILPAELLSFTASGQNRQVTLNWSTATEQNVDHFEIARNGIVRDAVDAAGESATTRNYSWIDREVQNDLTYEYSLISVDVDGARQTLGTVNATPAFDAYAVSEYALHQNYPNPFNPTTTITVDLAEAGFASLRVYNLLGQEVRSLINEYLPRGSHIALFDGTHLPSGVYVYKLDVNDYSAQRKMVLMK